MARWNHFVVQVPSTGRIVPVAPQPIPAGISGFTSVLFDVGAALMPR